MRAKFIIWLCNLLQLDYILAVRKSAGVLTKFYGSPKDLFMSLVAIILSMRNTMETPHERDLLSTVLQNLINEIKNGKCEDDSGRSETESGSADC